MLDTEIHKDRKPLYELITVVIVEHKNVYLFPIYVDLLHILLILIKVNINF